MNNNREKSSKIPADAVSKYFDIGANVTFGKDVKINTHSLTFGDNVQIGDNVTIIGGDICIGSRTKILNGVTINVKKKLFIKARGIIGKFFKMNGRDIEIGEEFWSGTRCVIGGGSCCEVHSKLRIGYWCHLGDHVFINTARPVYIGNEVGLGVRTSLYTHGAYQSVLDGFPVDFGEIRIGDNCWLPGAIVLPGVTIGKNTVTGVGAVVTRDIPEGCVAAGVPARVIKEKVYPKKLSIEEKNRIMIDFIETLGEVLSDTYDVEVNSLKNSIILNLRGLSGDEPIQKIVYRHTFGEVSNEGRIILVGFEFKDTISNKNNTIFDLKKRTINGKADNLSERLKNQLRRYGVRFKFVPVKGRYQPWHVVD